MRSFVCAVFFGGLVLGQVNDPGRVISALEDRALTEQAGRLQTDDRIKMYNALAAARPQDVHYEILLAATYIQKMRETMDFGYLDRAGKLLENVLSADRSNYEALRLRSEVELERHEFAKAASDSMALTAMAPSDSWNWGTLGDAESELGNYDRAAEAYQKMVNLRPDMASYNRAAYFRFLMGDVEGATQIMERAITAGSTSPENVAWCLVELGQIYFKSGREAEAERAFRAAIQMFPGYHKAYAALGQVQAQQGQIREAIASYRRAQASTPLPDYAGALYDLFVAAGDREEAARQMELVDVIDKLGQAAREKLNRNVAMVYANHDRRLERALELAQAEIGVRRDVYTWDAFAWALYKNGRYAEADAAMAAAMKLGTPEPAFYYHAGMIASALGKKTDAARLLKRALSLNPRFDLRQAETAEKALREMES
ncbi:MAG: tetratricopeptide repeat protein [Bryobacteraceae bacterium]